MRCAIVAVLVLVSSSLACSGSQPAAEAPSDLTMAPPPTAEPVAAGPESGNPAPEVAPSSPKSLPDRDPALARKLVHEGALLLDVRTQQEWDERHLDGASHIPVQELDTRLEEVDELTAGDHSKPIVVYCKSGGRAGKAKDKLVAAGYTQVTNLGGIDDWKKGCPDAPDC
jgi:phage shock protein E